MADSEEGKPRAVIIPDAKVPVNRLSPAERNKPPRTTKTAMLEGQQK